MVRVFQDQSGSRSRYGYSKADPDLDQSSNKNEQDIYYLKYYGTVPGYLLDLHLLKFTAPEKGNKMFFFLSIMQTFATKTSEETQCWFWYNDKTIKILFGAESGHLSRNSELKTTILNW